MKKYLMEGLGTFFLTLAVVMVSHPDAPGSVGPLAIGAMLLVLVLAGAPVSGAHYNPAVSLAMLMRGKVDRVDFFYYCLAQLAGGLMAAFFATFLLRCSGVPELSMRANDPACALMAEFLGSFVLVFAVVTVPDGNYGLPAKGLATGLAQFAGMVVFGSVSGGYFNLAMAAGLSLAGLIAWSDLWIYGLGTFLGAAAAVSIFRVIYGDQDDNNR